VSSLLERILSEVQAKCLEQGKTVHWAAFHDRILEPAVEGTTAPSMNEICRRHGIENPVKASNMIVTVKRMMQIVFMEGLRQSVSSEEEVQEELQEIRRFFPKLAQY